MVGHTQLHAPKTTFTLEQNATGRQRNSRVADKRELFAVAAGDFNAADFGIIRVRYRRQGPTSFAAMFGVLHLPLQSGRIVLNHRVAVALLAVNGLPTAQLRVILHVNAIHSVSMGATGSHHPNGYNSRLIRSKRLHFDSRLIQPCQLVKPRCARNLAANARVLFAVRMIVQPQQSLAAALERHVSARKNALRFEHDDLVEVRLLAHGAGEVLLSLWVHLDRHVVAVVAVDVAGGSEAAGCTARFAAARPWSRRAFGIEGRTTKGIFSDGVGSAEGCVTHENVAVLHLTLGQAATRVRMRAHTHCIHLSWDLCQDLKPLM